MADGRYIAFEGAEGCGKSTISRLLALEFDAVLTREHGGTRIGKQVRAIVANPDHTELDDRAEALLIAGDRAQHLAEIVVPALASGRHVVSDRSVHSTIAYQGYGRGLALDDVRRINDWAIRGRWPDLVIFLDVSPDVQAQRLAYRALDRFEQAAADFHERVVNGFRTMAAADSLHWVTINSDAPVADVHAAAAEAVHERLHI